MKTRCLIVFLFLMVPRIVWSQDDDTQLNVIALRGTGCPKGSSSFVISPDKKEISFLYDHFGVEVPQYDGNNDNDDEDDASVSLKDRRKANPALQRKVCNIVVESVIPQGEKIESLEIGIDFRGYTSAEEGVVANFQSLLLERRGMGIRRKNRQVIEGRIWRGGQNIVDEDWTIRSSKNIHVGSRCAKRGERKMRFVLKQIIGARMNKRALKAGKTGALILDTTDLKGALKLKMRTSRCSGFNPGPRPRPNPRRPRRPHGELTAQPRPRTLWRPNAPGGKVCRVQRGRRVCRKIP